MLKNCSCNGPAFSFTCPNVQTSEDETFANLEISHGPGFMVHSYILDKSTGESFYTERGALGPPNISNVIKSLVGWNTCYALHPESKLPDINV